MRIIKLKKELEVELNKIRSLNKSIGFVPTMGALHNGHLSLIRVCGKENDIVVSSIFVNPTQFNDKTDLEKYPRMPEKDFKMLESEGCNIVFYPDVEEMYPEKDTRTFDFGILDKVMEGAHRPGHFNGVAQVVSKLFDAVQPDRAYFGEKDFQQLAIIKKMVKDLKYNITIVPCPIVREDDGLAMSSRNLLLGQNERSAAPTIYATLRKAAELKRSKSIDETKNWIIEEINKNPYLKIEYFEIVDDINLQPLKSWEQNIGIVGCIAVKAGKIRLIDNIRF